MVADKQLASRIGEGKHENGTDLSVLSNFGFQWITQPEWPKVYGMTLYTWLEMQVRDAIKETDSITEGSE